MIAVRPHNAGRVWFPWQAIYLRVWITEPEMGGRKVVTLSWGQHCSTETKCLRMENGTCLCPSGSSLWMSQVKSYFKKWISLILLKVKSELWPSLLHFTPWMLILSFRFSLLFLFLLQVLKCHPPVLGSYSEGVCRGRGADGSWGGGLWINSSHCLAGGHFYDKVEVISDTDMNETWVALGDFIHLGIKIPTTLPNYHVDIFLNTATV